MRLGDSNGVYGIFYVLRMIRVKWEFRVFIRVIFLWIFDVYG